MGLDDLLKRHNVGLLLLNFIIDHTRTVDKCIDAVALILRAKIERNNFNIL